MHALMMSKRNHLIVIIKKGENVNHACICILEKNQYFCSPASLQANKSPSNSICAFPTLWHEMKYKDWTSF